MASGIYKITNIINDNVYIGKAQDITKRWNAHRSELKRNCHANHNLQADWNKYGESAFQFEVIEYCTLLKLDERERYHLNSYKQQGHCYNVHNNMPSPYKPFHLPKFDRKYSTEELLVLLNQHKTVLAVAKILGMSEANLFRNLQRRGFEKIETVIWYRE